MTLSQSCKFFEDELVEAREQCRERSPQFLSLIAFAIRDALRREQKQEVLDLPEKGMGSW